MNLRVSPAPQNAKRLPVGLLDGVQPVSKLGMGLQVRELAQHGKIREMRLHLRRIQIKELVKYRPQLIQR
ncbi:hypothetical protein D3C76_1813710 [compost metagenome]